MVDMPIAAFIESPNIWTFLTLTWLLVLLVSVGQLERKLDRIMKHLGLGDETPKPAPTRFQSWARPRSEAFGMHARGWGIETRRAVLKAWTHPRLRPLRRCVRGAIAGSARFIDHLLDRPHAGKGPAQDEV